MQVAGSTYPTTQPLYPYPNHYHHHHHPIPVAHDHELKRQYLTLLPPQQIIEICLTFDVHVPPYVKASIWPIDIGAAIAGLRKQTVASSLSKQPQDAEAKDPLPATEGDTGGAGADEGAIMDSLTAGSGESIPEPEPTQATSKQNVEEPRPPDKEVVPQDSNDLGENRVETTSSATSAAGASATVDGEVPSTSPTSTSSTSTNVPSTSETPAPETTAAAPPPPAPTVPPQPMSVAYPHQPYGYPYAPYYPPPPPGYPYPHHQYPAYHHQAQHPYSAPPPTSMAPVPPPAPPMQMMQDGQSADDLPSYEEMIVEALMDSNDPEGCAPKDLFSWMAARYPVQSNFRPSASQALQKAYKRGRLEKSSNNKYRLNAAWEGGNTSRRTTRRPQTHAHTPNSNNPASSSPFTNAPLVHHQQQQQQHQAHQQTHPQHQSYPYASYPYPQGAYSGFTSQPPAPAPTAATPAAPQPPQAGPTTSTSGPKSPETGPVQDKEANDAYEAAQNILKAINFGSLLQLPADETQEGVASRGSGTSNAALGSHQPAKVTAPPQTLLAALNGARAVAAPPVPAPADASAQPSSSRADLQAQLALLAAQLAELARVDDGPTVAEPAPSILETSSQGQGQHVQEAPPAVPQNSEPPQRNTHPAGAPVVARQPIFNSPYPYPYPHLQQFQVQAPPPPVQPVQPVVDDSAPMASLFPPSPQPLTSPSPDAQKPIQSPQMVAQTPSQAPSLMQVIQSQAFSQQPPATAHHSPAPATSTNEHMKPNGDIPPNGDAHERPIISDGLAPLESMDTELDAEYSSDEDDDMEEVV